jgi:hypothetical protein
MGGTNAWWPAELGQPSSSGGPTESRSAYFPHVRRLAVDRGGHVTVYDTLDHQIGGVQQQQGGYNGTASFSSQYGTFTVDSLPIVSPAAMQPQNAPRQDPPPPPSPPQAQLQDSWTSSPATHAPSQSHDAILAALERLAQLHQKGILSDDEFRSKKAELLSRI